VGAAVGAALSFLLLDPEFLPKDVGWRVCFALGAILGLAILLVRRFVPESPRWLMTHGRVDEAEEVVAGIEKDVSESAGVERLDEPEGSIEIVERGSVGFPTIARTVLTEYPRRFVLGFSLMASQAFLYNAIFFTYALVLTTFYEIDASRVPLFLLPFAAGNFLGPLLLGRLFDVVGRRPMIAGCYILSAVLLAVTGYLFQQEQLSATTQTVAWSVIFFFASAAASAGYLTVSEVFPLEIRAMAIAFFYAVATAAGGLVGPWLFGTLIESETRTNVFYGYLIGAGLMFVAGLVEIAIGVEAEQKSLEEVATPVTAQEAEGAEAAPSRGREERAPRRYRRSGPATAYPLFSGVGDWEDTVVDGEIGRLEAALTEQGPLSRDALGKAAGCRYWGPGRFRRALRAGLAEGRIRRVGRNRYDLPVPRFAGRSAAQASAR
jgi:MFS family permease